MGTVALSTKKLKKPVLPKPKKSQKHFSTMPASEGRGAFNDLVLAQ
jgi:hypothetical protein